MVVQNNLLGISALRNLNINNNDIVKSLEKLSSGYKVNRAGDDAAGFAMSEKMRTQIAGLNQAVKNSCDGVSMVQTFEGALTESHAILGRMRELAVQAANGIYDDEIDRAASMLEFRNLAKELDQIADTDFNGIVMLNGGRLADGSSVRDSALTFKDTMLLQTGGRTKDLVEFIIAGKIPNINISQNANVFRYVYGTWLTDSLNVLRDRAGLNVEQDFSMNVRFGYEDSSWVARMWSYRGARYAFSPTLEFNLRYIEPDGTFATPDGAELMSTAGLYMDRLMAHEITHALMWLNTGVTSIPMWYSEGLAEAVQGFNRYTWNFVSSEDDRLRVSHTNINNDIQNMSPGMTDSTVYSAGYLFVSWLDNYNGTSGNGPGQIKNLSAALRTASSFDAAVTAAFGKSQLTLMDEFKAESAAAAAGGAAAFESWLNTKLNIQIGDFMQDALNNTDAPRSGIVPNSGTGQDISAISDTVIHNGRTITLVWDFSDASSSSSPFLTSLYEMTPEERYQAAAAALAPNSFGGIGELSMNLDCSSFGLGITNHSRDIIISIAKQTDANYTIDQISFAINKVSLIRASFGAVQNRLEHKISNLSITSENLTAAESRIRDTNIAEEMMNFTKNQILIQSSQSMLAQASKLPQSIYELLK